MATLDQLLDSDRFDDITQQARQVNVARAVLLFVARVLVGFGRLLGWIVTAVVWVGIAVKVGYRDVRPAPVRPAGGGRGPA